MFGHSALSETPISALSGEPTVLAEAVVLAAGVSTLVAIALAAVSAAAGASGAATLEAAGASLASAQGLASGVGTVEAEGFGPRVPKPLPDPRGGGFGPGYRPDKQRFRIRKDKSKPKVITVRIGDWPEDPQIILAREEESERAAFYRQLSQRKDPEIIRAVDEEEQILMAILAAAA